MPAYAITKVAIAEIPSLKDEVFTMFYSDAQGSAGASLGWPCTPAAIVTVKSGANQIQSKQIVRMVLRALGRMGEEDNTPRGERQTVIG